MTTKSTAADRTALLDGRLLASAERRRLLGQSGIEKSERAALGQFFTPAPTAAFLASLFTMHDGPVRVLDAGAGVGSLAAAFADRSLAHGNSDVSITAIEVDDRVGEYLSQTIDEINYAGVDATMILADYVEWATQLNGPLNVDTHSFDCVIMNPPYFKLGTHSLHRAMLRSQGIEVSNMYAAFLMLAARQLSEGGELVAITPRSFANGSYFRRFRRAFTSLVGIDRIHLFESRSSVFSDADVLQENIVFRATKSFARASTLITVSESGAIGPTSELTVPASEVLAPGDNDAVLRLPSDEIDVAVARQMRRLRTSLRDLGLAVSTGQIVAFRLSPSQATTATNGSAPFLHQSNLRADGVVAWPIEHTRHRQTIGVNEETEPLLMPNGHYVVLRRFTAKEESRRLVAGVTDPSRLPGSLIGFENHLNVIHRNGGPLDRDLAAGLAAFLNSTIADRFFRQWSGHTQVNATDLRLFPYPTLKQLVLLGRTVQDTGVDSEHVDPVIDKIVSDLAPVGTEMEAVMAFKRLAEAREMLKALGMPPAQCNDRSALTLLALVNVKPRTRWRAAEAPLLGITPIMTFIADEYGRQYAPNTRETIRRQTIHQFMEAGLVRQNPDVPSRPVNSPQTVYQVEEGLLALIRTYGTERWASAFKTWQSSMLSLIEARRQERQMTRIPVTLPSGGEVTLSPGGQNRLIRAVLEDFCPRFTPAAHVLYVGDAEEKFSIWEREEMEAVGVRPDPHGKMPDLVVRDTDREWLIVVEAVTSHGPVDAKRRRELANIFGDATLRVLYITAFESRAALSEFINDISWETDVWLADSPTHLIHFDGERFLGPYE